MASFAYPSLRTELENYGLVLEIPLPPAANVIDQGRAWCSTLLGAMAWFSSQSGETYVWRGQRDADWPLQSRLNRHVASTLGGGTLADVAAAEREILLHVRHQRWHLRDGVPLRPLELAAVLQHHGVPTRLLDVTRDPLVAAFFASGAASREGQELDGAVVAIRVPRARVTDPSAEIETLDGTLSFEPPNSTYALWDPPAFDVRIVTQRGQFLVPNVNASAHKSPRFSPTAVMGVGIKEPKGRYRGKDIRPFFMRFLEPAQPGRPPAQPVNAVMVIVPAQIKDTLRNYLGSLGLNDLTIYPDEAGYASSFPPS